MGLTTEEIEARIAALESIPIECHACKQFFAPRDCYVRPMMHSRGIGEAPPVCESCHDAPPLPDPMPSGHHAAAIAQIRRDAKEQRAVMAEEHHDTLMQMREEALEKRTEARCLAEEYYRCHCTVGPRSSLLPLTWGPDEG